MLVKTLVALATEKMLLKTSGKTFLKGIDFMFAAGLAPERLSVMMTTSGKYVLQFHSKCDIRPFAANYPSFTRVLRGIVHVRAWRIKSIEFVNVAFDMKDVENLERTIDKLGVELVLLRNCTYPGVRRGEEAIRFLNALNRKKLAVVCEYGDDRLKHRISRRYNPPRSVNAQPPFPQGFQAPHVIALARRLNQQAAAAAAAAPNDAPQLAVVEENLENNRRMEDELVNRYIEARRRPNPVPYQLRRRRAHQAAVVAHDNVPAAEEGNREDILAYISPQMLELLRGLQDMDAARAIAQPQGQNAAPDVEREDEEEEEMELDENDVANQPQFVPVQEEPVAVEEGETTDEEW